MAQIDDGGPAYPVAEDAETAKALPWTNGMSKRERFAMAIIQGMASRGITDDDAAARAAFRIADAMLRASKQESTQ